MAPMIYISCGHKELCIILHNTEIQGSYTSKLLLTFGSWDSVVRMVITAMCWTIWDSNPSRGKRCFSSLCVDWLWGPHSLLFSGWEVFFPWGLVAGWWGWSPYSAKF